ncbi:MAG: cupredoxin domain-containing protein [Burkholderiales bacterium]|nr:cupredoxin domain-containing protein [Burkholderiales bacterium]
MRHAVSSLFAASLAALVLAAPAQADDATFNLTLKDHRFDPQSIEVPAGKKVKLLIKNLDSAAEEFDSDDLHREKVIPAGHEGVVIIGPLKAGTYKFQGEYNPKTASGTIVVK